MRRLLLTVVVAAVLAGSLTLIPATAWAKPSAPRLARAASVSVRARAPVYIKSVKPGASLLQAFIVEFSDAYESYKLSRRRP
jgi:hypothetical protein